MALLPCEGILAIHKPKSITSAQVIREVQDHFQHSKFFQPWLEREQGRKDAENHNQKQKRRSWKQRQSMKVKMGHGGTLDPMATGVLILGVGNGTKKLGDFLGCTKSYDAVVLFGAATDTYDAVGKIIGRKPYEHVTKDMVQEALGKFRGSIMQRPPIYSALKMDGKKLYEYAREGKEPPKEIVERPVDVLDLEMTEWMEGGTHEYRWPEEEADGVEMGVLEKVLQLDGAVESSKRKRDDQLSNGETGSPKRARLSPKPTTAPIAGAETASVLPPSTEGQQSPPSALSKAPCAAPACRIRMTVTSGFYVRSLCHDLGAAVGSLGLMSTLVRTRQGDYELGRNVLEYDDLEKGEEIWRPKVEEILAVGRREGLPKEGIEEKESPVQRDLTTKGEEPTTEINDQTAKVEGRVGGYESKGRGQQSEVMPRRRRNTSSPESS